MKTVMITAAIFAIQTSTVLPGGHLAKFEPLTADRDDIDALADVVATKPGYRRAGLVDRGGYPGLGEKPVASTVEVRRILKGRNAVHIHINARQDN